MTVGILALAAGRSRRFGSDKRVATLPDGRRVLDAFINAVSATQLPLLLCLDAGDTALATELGRRGIALCLCQRAGEGMGGTLAEGSAHLSNWDGVLIALADMPWIDALTYTRIAEDLDDGVIRVPTYAGRRGHPVGFGKQYFSELRLLKGDAGARELLEKHRAQVEEVPVADQAIHRDIDVPAELAIPEWLDQ